MKRFVCLVLALMMLVACSVPAGAGTALTEQFLLDAFAVERSEPDGLEDVLNNFLNMVAGGGVTVGEARAFTPSEEDGGYAEEIPITETLYLLVYWDVQDGDVTKIQLVSENRANSHNEITELFNMVYLEDVICGAILQDATQPEVRQFTSDMIKSLNQLYSSWEYYISEDKDVVDYIEQVGSFNMGLSYTEQHIKPLKADFSYMIWTVTLAN